MTGTDIKHLRATKGWTLREMADYLGDVDPSTLSRWETAGTVAVPKWVAAKLLTTTTLTVPLAELDGILAHARTHGLNLALLLAAAIREYLAERSLRLPHPRDVHAALEEL